MDCPFCNKPLKKNPSRKTKCPHCLEFIYVRTDPTTKEQIFVNKKRADEIDEEWSTTISSYEIVKYLNSVGIDENTFVNKKKALFELYKTPIRDSNVAFIMLNGLITSFSESKDYQLLRRIYHTMALIEHLENRPFFHLLVETHKCELLHILEESKLTGVDEVKIFVPVGECENCLELDGKVFKIINALETMPLPNSKCNHGIEENGSSKGWCMCIYQPVIDIQKFLNEKYHQ